MPPFTNLDSRRPHQRRDTSSFEDLQQRRSYIPFFDEVYKYFGAGIDRQKELNQQGAPLFSAQRYDPRSEGYQRNVRFRSAATPQNEITNIVEGAVFGAAGYGVGRLLGRGRGASGILGTGAGLSKYYLAPGGSTVPQANTPSTSLARDPNQQTITPQTNNDLTYSSAAGEPRLGRPSPSSPGIGGGTIGQFIERVSDELNTGVVESGTDERVSAETGYRKEYYDLQDERAERHESRVDTIINRIERRYNEQLDYNRRQQQIESGKARAIQARSGAIGTVFGASELAGLGEQHRRENKRLIEGMHDQINDILFNYGDQILEAKIKREESIQKQQLSEQEEIRKLAAAEEKDLFSYIKTVTADIDEESVREYGDVVASYIQEFGAHLSPEQIRRVAKRAVDEGNRERKKNIRKYISGNYSADRSRLNRSLTIIPQGQREEVLQQFDRLANELGSLDARRFAAAYISEFELYQQERTYRRQDESDRRTASRATEDTESDRELLLQLFGGATTE